MAQLFALLLVLLGNTCFYRWVTLLFVLLGDEEDEQSHYKTMVERDERRWKRADKDGDNMLSKEEFTDFLHPEEAEHMQDTVVEVSGTL